MNISFLECCLVWFLLGLLTWAGLDLAFFRITDKHPGVFELLCVITFELLCICWAFAVLGIKEVLKHKKPPRPCGSPEEEQPLIHE